MRPPFAIVVVLTLAALPLGAQSLEWAESGAFKPPTPSPAHRQDVTRDNLVHPAGYIAAKPGELAEVVALGDGAQSVVLIPGLGHGWRLFQPLIAAGEKSYRFHGVTLPGFGGSSAWPMPEPGTRYVEQSWTRMAQETVVAMIRREKLEKPILVAYYSEAAFIALGAALAEPELIGGVLVITACPRSEVIQGADRAGYMELMALQWFKTVTPIMWPSGMWPPAVYSRQADVAERTWWETLQPTLPTAIRWTVEPYAVDLVPALNDLKVPTTVLAPGLDEKLRGWERASFLDARFVEPWQDAVKAGAPIDLRVVEEARFLIWVDRPEAVTGALAELAAAARGAD